MSSGVVRSKGLCGRDFSGRKESSWFEYIPCGQLPHGEKRNKREHSYPLEGWWKDFKTSEDTNKSTMKTGGNILT